MPIPARHLLLGRVLLGTVVAAMFTASPAVRADEGKAEEKAEKPARAVDKKWLERLDQLDRALLDDLIGFAPPPMATDLTWIGSEALTWEGLRGKVVVLQSWSHATSSGRQAPQLVDRALPKVDDKDVAIVLLQTPDGVEGLQRFLERRKIEWPIALDSTGRFCDDLGIYKEPVNIVVDRNGTVRYAGLTVRGLRDAVQLLVDEKFDKDERPAEKAAAEPLPPAAAFPTFTDDIGKARDFRGKRAPEFIVDEWVTARPDPSGKVVLIDLWATWCRPCILSVPHLNELADAFRDDVVVVGVCLEDKNDFERGMQKLRSEQNVTLGDFRYAVALDDKSTMNRAIENTSIPYCLVMSADWTVRWQGSPRGLSRAVLQRIVDANRDAQRKVPGNPRARRWAG